MLRERPYSVPVLVRSGLLLPELNIKTQFANDVEREQTNSDSLWVKEPELLTLALASLAASASAAMALWSWTGRRASLLEE